jgi:hypothetical protein
MTSAPRLPFLIRLPEASWRLVFVAPSTPSARPSLCCCGLTSHRVPAATMPPWQRLLPPGRTELDRDLAARPGRGVRTQGRRPRPHRRRSRTAPVRRRRQLGGRSSWSTPSLSAAGPDLLADRRWLPTCPSGWMAGLTCCAARCAPSQRAPSAATRSHPTDRRRRVTPNSSSRRSEVVEVCALEPADFLGDRSTLGNQIADVGQYPTLVDLEFSSRSSSDCTLHFVSTWPWPKSTAGLRSPRR